MRRSPMKRGKPMRTIGKKGKAWIDARAELKIEFEFTYGITTCELHYEGCWIDNALGFAHAAKRRKLSNEDLKHVILCCNPCHDQIEFLSPEKMKKDCRRKMSAKRIDANQPSIVRSLREIGATVQSLASVGSGCPDLLVGYRGKNHVFEIKDWKQPPSKRKLTPDEKKWHQSWQGQVHVVETFDEALKIIS